MVPVSDADAINVPSLFNVKQRMWDLCAFIMLTRFFSWPVGETSTNWICPIDLAGKARMVLDRAEEDADDTNDDMEDEDPCTGATGDDSDAKEGEPVAAFPDSCGAEVAEELSLNVVEFTLRSANPYSLSMVSYVANFFGGDRKP